MLMNIKRRPGPAGISFSVRTLAVLLLSVLLVIVPTLSVFATDDEIAGDDSTQKTSPVAEIDIEDNENEQETDDEVSPSIPLPDMGTKNEPEKEPLKEKKQEKKSILVVDEVTDTTPAKDTLIESLATGFSSDLSNFITAVSMYDMSGNPIGPGTTTYVGQTYNFAVSFAETTTLQLAYTSPGGVLTYQLPSNLSIATAVPQTPLYGNAPNNAIIGWYTIDTNGLVNMWFNNVDLNGKPTPNNMNFIDYYANVDITFNVFAQLVGSSGSTNNISFGNGVTITILAPTEPPPSLTMLKSSQYDPTNEVINYTIVITALGGSVSGVTLTDAPTLTSGTTTYNNFVGPDAYSNFEYMINDTMGPETATPTWSTSPLSFTINNFEDTAGNPLILASGDTITLTYTASISAILAANNAVGQPLAGQSPNNYNFTMNNTATAGGLEADNDAALTPVSDSTTDHVNRDLELTKVGVYNATTGAITWTLTLGDGYSLDLSGGAITDILSGSSISGANIQTISTPISVEIYDGPSTTSTPTWTGTADQFASFVQSATGFTFNLADASPALPDLPILEVVIVFETTVTPPQAGVPASIYNNTLDFTDPDGTTGAAFAQVPVAAPNVNITKTSKGICGSPTTPTPGPNGESYWIDYTITVDVPGGLQGQQLYLFDDLGIFPAGDAVVHTPEDVIVTITPSAAEAGTALLYSGPVQMYGNSWRIFFGTDVSVPNEWTVPATTSWQYNDPAELSVTYRAYISDAYVSDLQSAPTQSLQNAVYLINCTYDPVGYQAPDISPTGNSVGGVNTVDYWPIFKTVLGTNNPAVFAYTSSINGGVRTPSLLQAGYEPIFTDTFDPRMEYVPGTFYIYDSTSNTYYAPSSDVVLNAAGDSFSTDLSSSDWEVISGPLPGGNYVSSAPTNWFATNHTLQTHYELEILPQNLGTSQSGLTNTAIINVNAANPDSCVFSNDVATSYAPEILQKTMTPVQPGGDLVYVEIIVNANGGYVFSDGSSPAPNPVTAVDLFQNLMIYTGTIQMYTQTLVGGVWDGTWTEVTPVTFNDGNPWSVTVVPPSSVPAGYSGQIDFTIPNQTPVKITYQALVDLPVGTQGPISNEISILGVRDSDGDGQYVVGSQGVGVNAGRQPLRVFKTDPAGNNLSGANFSLYVTDISTGYTPPMGLSSAKTIAASGGTTLSFGLITDEINGLTVQTTGVNGMAVFNNMWINSSDDLLYLLVENSTPTDYYNLTPYTFLTMNPSITQANVNSLNSLLAPVLLTGQSVTRISDFTDVINYEVGTDADSLRIVKKINGLTQAQIQKYLKDFQIVVVDTFQHEYVFDLSAALDPKGIVFQYNQAGTFTISERNQKVSGYDLKTTPQLPYKVTVDTTPGTETLVTVTNTYSQASPVNPPAPVKPNPPSPPNPHPSPPKTGDMFSIINMLFFLLILFIIITRATSLTNRRETARIRNG